APAGRRPPPATARGRGSAGGGAAVPRARSRRARSRRDLDPLGEPREPARPDAGHAREGLRPAEGAHARLGGDRGCARGADPRQRVEGARRGAGGIEAAAEERALGARARGAGGARAHDPCEALAGQPARRAAGGGLGGARRGAPGERSEGERRGGAGRSASRAHAHAGFGAPAPCSTNASWSLRTASSVLASSITTEIL